MLIRLFWGCGAVTGAGLMGGWADGEQANGGTGQRGNGPTGAITGTCHYRMTSRMPSSAREEGFQIFMYFVHYNHFSRLQID